MTQFQNGHPPLRPLEFRALMIAEWLGHLAPRAMIHSKVAPPQKKGNFPA